jgi:hypothetical protein
MPSIPADLKASAPHLCTCGRRCRMSHAVRRRAEPLKADDYRVRAAALLPHSPVGQPECTPRREVGASLRRTPILTCKLRPCTQWDRPGDEQSRPHGVAREEQTRRTPRRLRARRTAGPHRRLADPARLPAAHAHDALMDRRLDAVVVLDVDLRELIACARGGAGRAKRLRAERVSTLGPRICSRASHARHAPRQAPSSCAHPRCSSPPSCHGGPRSRRCCGRRTA